MTAPVEKILPPAQLAACAQNANNPDCLFTKREDGLWYPTDGWVEIAYPECAANSLLPIAGQSIADAKRLADLCGTIKGFGYRTQDQLEKPRTLPRDSNSGFDPFALGLLLTAVAAPRLRHRRPTKKRVTIDRRLPLYTREKNHALVQNSIETALEAFGSQICRAPHFKRAAADGAFDIYGVPFYKLTHTTFYETKTKRQYIFLVLPQSEGNRIFISYVTQDERREKAPDDLAEKIKSRFVPLEKTHLLQGGLVETLTRQQAGNGGFTHNPAEAYVIKSILETQHRPVKPRAFKDLDPHATAQSFGAVLVRDADFIKPSWLRLLQELPVLMIKRPEATPSDQPLVVLQAA